MSDFLDFIKEVGLPTIFISGVLAFSILGLAYIVDRSSCSGFEEATGYTTKYTGLQCYAEIDGRFVPKKYVFGDAKEIRLKGVK